MKTYDLRVAVEYRGPRAIRVWFFRDNGNWYLDEYRWEKSEAKEITYKVGSSEILKELFKTERFTNWFKKQEEIAQLRHRKMEEV